MKLLFLDTETTGLDPVKNGVIQIAGLIECDGQVMEEFNFKCRPMAGKILDAKAMQMHKETRESLLLRTPYEDCYASMVEMFDRYIDRYSRDDKFYMVGQNTKFDYDFMAQWFLDNGNKYWYAYVRYHLIDLVQTTAMFHVAGKMALPNMKLETVAKSFGFDFQAHDAFEDIKVTRKIFQKYTDLIRQVDMTKNSEKGGT